MNWRWLLPRKLAWSRSQRARPQRSGERRGFAESRQGFEEAGGFPERPGWAREHRLSTPRPFAPPHATPLGRDSAPAAPRGLPFASTGPEGHRGRMRERLLQRGPDSLADYEMLEMLLFFAFKKGDTKPLAKALINQLGSLPEVLLADPKHLRRLELGLDSIAAIKLVEAAAARLAGAETMERPLLGSWDGLMRYLGAAAGPAEGARALFLDNRNRLLADEAVEPGFAPRAILRRTLALHATALILLTHRLPGPGRLLREADVAATEALRRAGAVFSVTVHDHLVLGGASPLSLRREGLV